jgi:hypothetical protein
MGLTRIRPNVNGSIRLKINPDHNLFGNMQGGGEGVDVVK